MDDADTTVHQAQRVGLNGAVPGSRRARWLFAMRGRAGRACALAVSALALLAAGAIWQLAYRAPTVDLLPLPERLVSLTADEGRRLLAESPASADYPPLMRTFESQRRPAYCGVASSVAVLNALRPSGARLTQATTCWSTISAPRSASAVAAIFRLWRPIAQRPIDS